MRSCVFTVRIISSSSIRILRIEASYMELPTGLLERSRYGDSQGELHKGYISSWLWSGKKMAGYGGLEGQGNPYLLFASPWRDIDVYRNTFQKFLTQKHHGKLIKELFMITREEVILWHVDSGSINARIDIAKNSTWLVWWVNIYFYLWLTAFLISAATTTGRAYGWKYSDAKL